MARRELRVPACPARGGRNLGHFRSTQRLCPHVSTCHRQRRGCAEEGANWGDRGGGQRRDPAWICPGAEVFPDPWGAGEGGGGPARAGTMLNMWKVRELVDKA